jgi:hypothetical protein
VVIYFTSSISDFKPASVLPGGGVNFRRLEKKYYSHHIYKTKLTTNFFVFVKFAQERYKIGQDLKNIFQMHTYYLKG